jgi:hypothetical protein
VNADIPFFRCWVRLPYISKQQGVEEAYAFAVQSYPGRALAFHCMLKSGAHYRGVPIHALALQPDAPVRMVGELQLWDCFTARPIVHCYNYLRDHQANCRLRYSTEAGVYLFTVDWLPDDSGPGFTHLPEQNKCAHVLALDDGNLCALPTNRIAWLDGYFIGRNPDPRSRRYTVQEEVWQAEDAGFDASLDTNYIYEAQACPRSGDPEADHPV